MDPQDATPFDCPDPPSTAESLATQIAQLIAAEKCTIGASEIEYGGHREMRLMMASGQIFRVKIIEE